MYYAFVRDKVAKVVSIHANYQIVQFSKNSPYSYPVYHHEVDFFPFAVQSTVERYWQPSIIHDLCLEWKKIVRETTTDYIGINTKISFNRRCKERGTTIHEVIEYGIKLVLLDTLADPIMQQIYKEKLCSIS